MHALKYESNSVELLTVSGYVRGFSSLRQRPVVSSISLSTEAIPVSRGGFHVQQWTEYSECVCTRALEPRVFFNRFFALCIDSAFCSWKPLRPEIDRSIDRCRHCCVYAAYCPMGTSRTCDIPCNSSRFLIMCREWLRLRSVVCFVSLKTRLNPAWIDPRKRFSDWKPWSTHSTWLKNRKSEQHAVDVPDAVRAYIDSEF